MLGELALQNAMKVEVYAEGVASNVLKLNPKKIQWIGGETFLIWFGHTFGWATIWVTLSPESVEHRLTLKRISSFQE